MYSDPSELTKASRTVKRQAAREWELSYMTLDAVFRAKGTAELRTLLDVEVHGNPKYKTLPKFRQIALHAYFRGVCDAVARVAGVSTPKSAPPKKTRKVPVKPKLHPAVKNPPAPVPLPSWVENLKPPAPGMMHRPETVLPPPSPPMSPFPPAADLGQGAPHG